MSDSLEQHHRLTPDELRARIAELERELADAEDDGRPHPDRDTWCTPLLYALALGRWGLDPCSNERSHIVSDRTFRLANGQNGLVLAKFVSPRTRVFCNPPYSDVLPWVLAYGHTRFCFLLKFDPSTKWCRELLARTGLILFPEDRIKFEPPPGVEATSNQFPHGFFFAREEDATPEIRALCHAWRPVR